MREILSFLGEAILIFLKSFLLAFLMVLPTAYGIWYAADGRILPAAICLASGLIGATMVAEIIKGSNHARTNKRKDTRNA